MTTALIKSLVYAYTTGNNSSVVCCTQETTAEISDALLR